jgi:hypothetical protein
VAATEDEYREPAGDNSQELLAARGQTVHNEAAALGPAAVKSEFIIAISSGNLSSGVLFKMVKHDLAGQSLWHESFGVGHLNAQLSGPMVMLL